MPAGAPSAKVAYIAVLIQAKTRPVTLRSGEHEPQVCEHQRAEDPARPVAAVAVAEAVRQRFGVAIHPRSLVRALGRGKNWPRSGETAP